MPRPASRTKDPHVCALIRPGSPPIPHVAGPLDCAPRPVKINSQVAATYGDEAECTGVGSAPPPRDSINGGFLKVFVGGNPAARLGETTFGGAVTAGSPNVVYGDSVAVLAEAAANWLHQYLAQQKDIPFNHPWDGCYARAQEMGRIMQTQFGVELQKIFVYGNLQPVTGTLHTNLYPTSVAWGYHVAPLVQGLRPDGSAVEFVVDPSMSPNTITTREEWLRLTTGSGSASNVSVQPATAYAPAGGGGYVQDPTYAHTQTTMSQKRALAASGDRSDSDADLSSYVAAKKSFPRPVVHPPHVP